MCLCFPPLQKKEVWDIPPLMKNETLRRSSFTEGGNGPKWDIPPLRKNEALVLSSFTEEGTLGHSSFAEQCSRLGFLYRRRKSVSFLFFWEEGILVALLLKSGTLPFEEESNLGAFILYRRRNSGACLHWGRMKSWGFPPLQMKNMGHSLIEEE